MKFNRPIIEFLVKFFVIFGVLHALLLVVDLVFFQKAITEFQAGLLGLPFNETSIFIDNVAFLIVVSCTGIVSAIILGAIIFSLKKPPIKEKIIIFLAGTTILLIANQFRIYFVLLVGMFFGVHWAEIAHVLSWFATTIAIIFAWFYFTKKITKIDDFSGFL